MALILAYAPSSFRLTRHHDRICRCVMFCMREAYHHLCHASLFSADRSRAAKSHFRLAAWATKNLHVEPTNIFPNSCSKSFRNRFLCCKPCCVVQFRTFLPLTIAALLLGEDPVEELLSKLVHRRPDSGHLNNIDPDPNQVHFTNWLDTGPWRSSFRQPQPSGR